MKICEKCNIEHNGSYASGRFCSAKCSRSFSTSIKRKEINQKVKNTWEKKDFLEKKRSHDWLEKGIIRNCKFCNIEFQAKRCHQISCSRNCVRINHNKFLTEEQKLEISKKMSLHTKARHERGDKVGWTTRAKFAPSYPELIAIRFFNSNNISYIRELCVGRYFVDFALLEHKIAIEIDGQQHNKPERIKSDERKDALLKKEGWKVFRIKWPNNNIIDGLKKILQTMQSLNIT